VVHLRRPGALPPLRGHRLQHPPRGPRRGRCALDL